MAIVLTQSFTRAPFSQHFQHPRQPPKPLRAVRLPHAQTAARRASHLLSPCATLTPEPGKVRAAPAMSTVPPPPELTETTVTVARVALSRNPAPLEAGNVPSAEASRLHVTKSMEKSIHYLAKNWAAGIPVKLEGATGVGKTAVIRHLAHVTNSEYVRVNLSYFTEVEDLLGRHVGGTHEHTAEKLAQKTDAQLCRLARTYDLPLSEGREALIVRILNTQGQIRWVDGPVVKAMQRGAVLLLDEINLARPEVIEALNGLFDRNQLISQSGVQNVVAHPNFRLFATQNPASYAGRQDMSAALSSRWASLTWESLPADELFEVLQSRYAQALSPTLFAKLCMAHTRLAAMAEAGRLGGDRGGVAFTLRDLFKVTDRFIRYRAKNPPHVSDAYLLAREVYEVYMGGLDDPADRQRIRAELKPFLPAITEDFYAALTLQRTARGWRLGEVELEDRATGHVFVPKTDLVMTPTTLEIYARLFKALDMRENVALIGERASGKSAMGEAYAAHAGLPFYPEHFDAGMDGSRLIGTDTPLGWQDGLLLAAARNGGVLLADEFNLAPPEILERLNSLLDDERMLVLAEKEAERVELHPDFRFIATMNPPKYAGRHKLSRAMLNRLTCIAVPTLEAANDLQPIVAHKLEKAPSAQPAAVNAAIAGAIVGLHTWVSRAYRMGELGRTLHRKEVPDFSLRQVLYVTRLVTRFSSTDGVAEALRDALNMGYAQAGSTDDKAMVTNAIDQAVAKVTQAMGADYVAPPPPPPPERDEDGQPRTLFFENGVYHGETKNGLAHGLGNEQFLDGTIYEGAFENGLRHGRGVLRAVDRIYTGDFVQGHLEGRGILRYANGDRYEGEFKDDTFHGEGTFFYADGERMDGTFERGVLLEGKSYDAPPADAATADPSVSSGSAGSANSSAKSAESPSAKPVAKAESSAKSKREASPGTVAKPERAANARPAPGEPAMPPATAPSSLPRISKVALAADLQRWVDQSPRRLRNNYKTAAERIATCYEQHAELLDLDHLALESLPEVLEHLQGHLLRLRLDDSNFKTLPLPMCKLFNLRLVSARRSRLEFLPPEMGQLTNLTELQLSGNRLQSLPAALGNCRRLQHLRLADNLLEVLPIGICKLQELQHLDLTRNALRELPAAAYQWSALTHLDLGNNNLAALPNDMTNWANLDRLDLSANPLESLPEALSRLPNLAVLLIENNRLRELPDWLADMPKLRAVLSGTGRAKLSAKLRSSRIKFG